MDYIGNEMNMRRQENESIRALEKIREKRKQEEQTRENKEWEQNQAEFLKKRVKNQEQRISDLEGMVLQIASQLTKQSNDGWKLDWSKV